MTFYQTTTTGYYPKQNTYLWTYQQSNPKPTKIQDIKIKNMIFLGNTNKADPGTTINDVPKGNSQTFKHQIDTYIQNNGYWGNIFISAYLKGPQPILYSTSHPRTLLKSETYYKDSGDTTLQEADFKQVTEKFLINCRYNPFPDTGKDNKIYFTDITSQQHNWDPPEDQTLQNNNFPLWIGLFGLTDWAKLTKTAELIDTKRVLTLSSKYISSNLKTIVPIDEDVLNGVSPFRKDISGSDSLFWHPKTSFQYKVINNIAACGPGTLKLPPNVSAEGHVKFFFYFKLGGCTQPKRTIEDPEKQPIVASTNNILQSNSLQNPYQSIESYLFPFDWRRDFLTKSALERIKKHKEPETTLFESTGVNLFVPKSAHRNHIGDGLIERGRRKRNITPPPQTPPKATTTIRAQNPPVNKFKIIGCKNKVTLFDCKEKKNRRFTPQEFEDELYIAKWLKRPPRNFIYDPPFYPWLPPEPKVPKVNFDLMFKE